MADLKTVKFPEELYDCAVAARAELTRKGYRALPPEWTDPQQCLLCGSGLEKARCPKCKITFFKSEGGITETAVATMSVFMLIGVNAILAQLSQDRLEAVGTCGTTTAAALGVFRGCGGLIVRRNVRTPFPAPHDRAQSLDMWCSRCGTHYEIGEHHELRVVPSDDSRLEGQAYAAAKQAATENGLSAKDAAKIAKRVETLLRQ